MLAPWRVRLLTGCVLLSVLLMGCAETQTQPMSTPPASQPVATGTRAGPVTTLTPGQPTPTATKANPASEVKPELAQFFQGNPGAFELYDRNANRYVRYDPERCAARFLPASTFKILNSLIGLETGVIPDQNYVIPWDGTRHDVAAWNQNHTLQTAIQVSAVWYYQELARRIGADKMQSYVAAANYGNKDISGRIDTFWLEGGLRISADEQVEFLKRLYQGDLPFSPRSMNIVKEILVLEETESYTFSGKTGSVQRIYPHTGWFVGYLETRGNVYFFATNYETTSPNGLATGEATRIMSRSILQGLGLLQ